MGLRYVSMDESRELGTHDIQSIDEGTGSSGRERSISPDTILSAVASEHRRATINALDNASDKTLEYDALVARVADRVRNEDPRRESDEHRQRVRIALHHTHLPKLEEARIIDYEAEMGNVQFVGGELERDLLTLVEPHVVHE
ncbi:DUF7344 domain-containing protein [Haloferax volcanii]|uniref:DUF7344 domain-containing protein n=1 Tax=Haloferax volcanii TaxID=2246 RepID=UPI0023D99133|nr:hypothetical protein [Haloferax lucentense]WEL27493.1 Putative trancriptional regulator, ArsR family [Haloferax lucentense]